ncbi:hypothetical protein LOTGIDRAFT_234474 [Lottia gigantea]|uniref:EGF-like domain-containing protein n=1 Tax=Lottia gigantea TaxID=225164 RepID=V4A5R4_LOTGI|nr:hypothetical protein LOTGIDRAFT_234474 [Lottia gigantea]ESO88616.1 hypothetical protein LOTGIDRAFT_234474 [Lottia gigantea]
MCTTYERGLKCVVKRSADNCGEVQFYVLECCQRPPEYCNDDNGNGGGNSEVCLTISNCDERDCAIKSDPKCQKCDGSVADIPGHRAYLISADKRLCKKACSWRPDSSRCYPGTCKDELFSNCDCSDGFTGNHCEKITTIPNILYNQVTLTADNNESVDAPGDFGAGSPQPITWTNIMKPANLYYCFQSNYYKPNTIPIQPFVVDYKVGIIDGKITFRKCRECGVLGRLDSGIAIYELEIFSMKSVGNELIIDKRVIDTKTTLQKSPQFNLQHSGVYSVILAAVDKAGNIRLARRCLIFDDNSRVSTVHDTNLKSTSASPSTNYLWQQNHGPVTIDWENRYINTKHHNGKYLAGIQDYHGLDPEYDDNNGKRTSRPIDNVQGIVCYETYYGLDAHGGSTIEPTDNDFTTTGYLKQSITISPKLQDGDTVIFYIRAYDIVDFYLEESTTVYFDMSPPVIKDLWLTKGDDLNIAVHEFHDFDKLVIEWIAYDLHSGLETVEWKLHDNFTGDVILHGSQHIPVQGEAQNLPECEKKYKTFSRGSDCYCTPAVGCYHQHFQVKPGVSLDKGTGLIDGKHQGVHDHDYYIEVNVMNNAKLNTTLIYKITIDTSPPNVGVVHDGRYGEPEVDYQPERNLQAHWEGFFDKESGLRYYHYGFSTRCLTAEEIFEIFEIQNTPGIFETVVTHATWFAPTDGQYFITVVAYNTALQPSQPVCSDGVVIDSTRPIVSEIFIDQARIEAGLVSKDGKLYYINNRRLIHHMQNPDPACLQKGRPLEDISSFPIERYPNQTIQDRDLCQEETLPIQYLTQSYLVEHSHIYVNWTGIDVESGIYDYQFGLSSERDSIPDLLPFHSTNHHAWYRGYHPQLTDGTEFFIHIKATNKAGLETIQTLGPIIVHTSKPKFTGNIDVNLGPLIVHTSKPKFSGKIDVVLDNNLLVANWSNAVVKDPGHSQLRYTTAIGTTEGGQEIIKFSDLNFNVPCLEALPPTCTVFDIMKLDWSLHHGYKYYISIKIENTVGLHTVISSESLTYKSLLPSKGVVIDVGLKSEMDFFNILELEDSDYQLSTSMVSVRWYGFESQEEISTGINYKVGIRRENDSEFIQSVHVSQQTEYTFIDLQLQLHQKYIVSVTATVAGVGSVTSSSDGMTVVDRSEDLSDEVELKDGTACFQPTDLEANHYDNSTGTFCGESTFQPSSSSYSMKWNISNKYYNIYPHINWSLQKQHQNTDIWLKEYEKELYTRDRMLTLPYRLEVCESYRSHLQFCIDNVCSKPVYSEGVTILGKPDKPKMNILMTTDQELNVSLEFTSPPTSESCDNVIKRLEWSITDNHNGRLLTLWRKVDEVVNNDNKIQLKIILDGTININKCIRLALRLFNKAGLSTLISKQIQNCSAVNPILMRPPIVIDAVKQVMYQYEFRDCSDPILIRPAIVLDVFRQENRTGIELEPSARWNEPDVDYTPYNDLISAVWPTLRHRNYTWGLLEGPLQPTSTLYSNPDIVIPDPCSHPSTIICGHSDKEYINIKPPQLLKHGRRYHVCLHADSTTLQHEKWDENLEEINSCSDGITVDLSPPSGGRVWIQTDTNTNYQVSSNTLTVFWDSFIDVEEEGGAVHPSGISHYTVQIAVDFVNRSKTVVSDGIIIDHTAPEIVLNRIQTPSPYLTSLDSISACWKESFKDSESGIKFYKWSVGSREGQTDILKTRETVENCDVATLNVNLQDGFTYYIKVQIPSGLKECVFIIDTKWSKRIPSVLKEYVFSGLSLHDGSKYNVKVIGCNLAGLCISSVSDDILVDTTPPTRDLHSGVQYYLLSVGTKPFYTDLNKDGKTVKYLHEDGRLLENEGEVQTKTVETAGNLVHGMSVFISIVATNGVGLKSQPIHNEFQLMHADLRTNDHGSLVRRCRPYNCEGHCVCSEQDKICPKPDGNGCITNDSDIDFIQVIDVTNLQSTDKVQTNYTPTNMFLSAEWRLLTNTTSQPVRYEVSIGLSDEDQPSGVFDSSAERHWFDVGQDMSTIITLTKDNTLHDNLVYSVFVRAWYDDKRYYIYKSPGITVISKPSTLIYIRGVAVKELEQTTSNKDIDYQINNNTIIVGWKDKFNGGIHGIDYYQVYISTHPQGHNIHRTDTKVLPQQKSFSISELKLQENKIYYSTVLAFNKAGFCSWSTSDGIIIDSTPPSTGIIHDGLGISAFMALKYISCTRQGPYDSEFQSSDSLISASWYGFSDIGSGIVNYNWCVGRLNDTTTCDILPWTNVGLEIKTTDQSPVTLKSAKIYHKVYAVDGSGLQSQVAVSNGIIIDTSPPEASYLEFIGENLILNPSFESISDDTTTSCNSNIPEHWSTDSQSCVKTRSSQHSTAHDGEVYITITDQIQQTIQNLDTDCSYQLTVHVGYPHDILLSNHMVEGFIRLGHEINSFKLNPDLCQGDSSQLVNVIHWYKFTYIYQPINTREKLVIGTTRNNMILAIDDLELRKINHVSLKDTNNNHIVYHPTFTPHWSSLHFHWYFKDSESSIVEYQWALGTVKGGTQIREFTTTGDRNHVTVYNLPLVHNSRLYFTVKARNGADLTSLSHSNYMLVDTTPPVVIHIHDGTADTRPIVVICIHDGTVDTTPPVVIYIHDSTDLTISSPSLFQDFSWSVHDDLCHSDHYPVILRNNGPSPVDRPQRWKLSKANWPLFEALCIYSFSQDDLDEAEDPMELFTTIFQDVLGQAIRKTSATPKRFNKPWFNEDCKTALKERNRALRLIERSPTADNMASFRIARAKARRTIRQAKRSSWQEYVSRINSRTSSKSVWDRIRRIKGRDVDYQTSNGIAVNWQIEDPESGLDYCLWAIGSVRGGNDIQKFTRIQKDENKASKEYIDREPIKVYSTIRCYNKVGLQVTVTTDGVQLIDSNKLITSSGQITLLPQTTTQYQLSQYCLTLHHSLGIRWQFGSNSYQSTSVMVGLSTDDYKLEKEMDETGINYDGVKLQGLKLKPETNYMVNISGILLGRLNNYINQTFSTGYQPPSVKEDRDIKIAKTLDGLTLIIFWIDIFVSNWKALIFEVSLGTKQGSGDVIQWQETRNDRIRLTLPKHRKYKQLYLTLTAVDPCGLFTTIRKIIVL